MEEACLLAVRQAVKELAAVAEQHTILRDEARSMEEEALAALAALSEKV
jgi:hypothetical protein